MLLAALFPLVCSAGCRQPAKQAPLPAPRQAAASQGVADRALSTLLPAQTTPVELPAATTTATLDKVDARFVAFGDSGVDTPEQRRVADAMADFCVKERCGFAIHTGDIVYPAGVQSPDDPALLKRLERPYAKLGIPLYLSIGNHEHYGKVDAMVAAWAPGSPARKRGLLDARLPARWYTFARDGVRFVVLDTEDAGHAQGVWADRVLEKSARDGEAWVVVVGHHPLRSSGSHGDALGELRAWLRKRLCRRADIYLSGHDHDKEVLAPECGVHQVVSGAGGQLRPIVAKGGSIWAASTLGWAWFVAHGDRMDLAFIDDNGQVEARRTFKRRPRAK